MKTKRKLLAILMTLAMVVSMIPAFGVTASATYNVGDIPGTTGKGTKSDPVIVDTFAELKAAMQSNEDLYIKVDRFQYPTGMKCYPLQNPEDYGTGDVAIRQVGKKHLEINTIVSLICLDNGNLYATIGVFGELTISGTGRIEGGFNADQSNSVFYVASPGKLNCNGLDVCVKNVQDTYGYAIDNYTGTVTVYSGLFQGWNAPAIINSNDSKLSIIGGAFEVTNKLGDKYALITGKQNVNISGGLFVTGLRCDDGQLNDLLVEGYSYYKNDYYTNANTLYNVSNNSSSSERLKVLSDQGDQKVISTVNISISAPKVGEKPQSAVLKTGNVLVTSTEWLCDGKTITSADKFEAGKSYAVQVKLKTENGYSFTDKPNVIFNDSTDGTVYASGTNYLYSQLKYSPISDSIEPTHVVNATALNVRESPDSSSARIGGVTKGKEVTVVETQGEWSKIIYGTGYGWVQSKYLTPIEKSSAKINPFEDVYESDNYYDAVLWAYYASPQVTNGMDETHFGPHLNVTRAQAVTFLWRSQGCPEPSSTVNPFVDVPTGEWYYKPVLWAVENNITKGTTDTTFDPGDTLTTAHIITFLYRTKNPGMDGWYGEAAAWAADSNGKPFGVDIAVNNTTPCPRCNVVQFLYKLSK